MNSKLFTDSQEIINILENNYCKLEYETFSFYSENKEYFEFFIYQEEFNFFSEVDFDLFKELSKFGMFKILGDKKHGVKISLLLVREHKSEG